jgi:glutamine phosphoribosylpyrophosphate amidotransferase
MHRFRLALVGAVAAASLALMAALPASAQTNGQSGLVNVNVQDLALQVPVSVAVPVSAAANVCGVNVNVLAQQLQNGPVSCTATSDSTALNTAIANAMTGQGGGGASNHQSGLVNVNLQDIAVQVPVSVAVPIGVAANVCGVNANVLASQAQRGSAACNATSSSEALSRAIAGAMV